MSDLMEYKEYLARVEVDLDAGVLHGEVINLRDVITFQATSLDELLHEFANSVEDYLAFCAERGQEPDRPFSGNIMLRMPPELHRAVATCATRANLSINKWIVAELWECTQDALAPETVQYSTMGFSNAPGVSEPVVLHDWSQPGQLGSSWPSGSLTAATPGSLRRSQWNETVVPGGLPVKGSRHGN